MFIVMFIVIYLGFNLFVNTMLHDLFRNPALSHHHYCGIVLLAVGVVQFAIVRCAPGDGAAGVTICAVALFTYFVKAHLSAVAIASSCFLFLWGLRISMKGIPLTRETIRSSFDEAVTKTIWIWLLCAPTVFATTMDAKDISFAPPFLGLMICSVVLSIDFFESGDVDGKFSRNPYAFSSIFISWGLFLMHPSRWTVMCPVIFSFVLLFAPGGTLWLEFQRRRQVMRDVEAMEYLRNTSPFFPLPQGAYARLPRVFRRIICFDI
jgi:hypothetical protein